MTSRIKPIINDVSSKKVSVRQVIEEALSKIESNSEYNSIISVVKDRALQRADEIDHKISNNEKVGRLAGVPFIAKDNFLSFGAPTTAASKILKDFQAPIQATAIEKLESEDAICIAKANLDAFAHGGSTETSAYGVTKNALDTSRVAGGSSGGSAVAVALDIVPFALGTDTGGSIRQPAAFNGVVGYKPSYGAVSRFGVVAMASSTDVVGPITHTSEDAEIIHEILSGKDVKDGTTFDDQYIPLEKLKTSKRIGLIKECMTEYIDQSVRDGMVEYAESLRKLGHTVEEVSIKTWTYSLPMYYIIVPAEVSSNLARYDGVRYGHRQSNKTLDELYGLSRSHGFQQENKRRILIGSYVLSSGYFDAYYNKAQKARTFLIQDFEKAFEEYDLLLSPTTPSPAFKIGENNKDPIKMYSSDILTVASSLAGLPAISIPIDKSEGLPLGAQFMAPFKKDAELLQFTRSLEELDNE